MGIVMIKCPSTGYAISTGIEMEQSRFDSSAVFFKRTFCPMCRTYHEWFAKQAWVSEVRGHDETSPTSSSSQSLRNRTDAARNEGSTFKCLRGTSMAVDKTVARLNVEHFRKKLATEQDETTRMTLLRLLAEEQVKLAALDDLLERKQRST